MKKRASPKRKSKLLDRRTEAQAGAPPGTPVHIGTHYDFEPYCTLFRYNANDTQEFDRIRPEALAAEIRADHVNWINVEGLHDIPLIQSIASTFDLHPLTVEDIVNTSMRPQIESFPSYHFFTLKMLYRNEDALTIEHVSIVLKGNVVLTFQETPGDVWARIRERIRAQTGLVCSRGSDYLVYMLIDSIVDGYYQVIDRLADKIDTVEESLQNEPRKTLLKTIFDMRREILILRKHIMPVRDLLNKVQVADNVFQANTQVYLRDLFDHIIQVADALGLSMEMSNVMIDTYHSIQNERLNQIMKTLTVISTIFLPLNFIAGVYGMNFADMPELHWHYGYPMALGTMSLVLTVMLLFFIRKGWIWESRTIQDRSANATPKD